MSTRQFPKGYEAAEYTLDVCLGVSERWLRLWFDAEKWTHDQVTALGEKLSVGPSYSDRPAEWLLDYICDEYEGINAVQVLNAGKYMRMGVMAYTVPFDNKTSEPPQMALNSADAPNAPKMMGRDALIQVLMHMANLIHDNDSFGGTITYEASSTHQRMFEVTGCYRVGNSQGQGGVRLIGQP